VSDEAAFLVAIGRAPEDDTARLVYADWLQERNDPRAEYVRLEVRYHQMSARARGRTDVVADLGRLRARATPGWLSRIDRVTRLSMFWPQDVCRHAEQNGLVCRPLARVDSRGNHNTVFPKVMAPGDYLYVFAFRAQLLLVGRMRVAQRLETSYGATDGVEGTEGSAIRFTRAVPDEAIAQLSWFSGKKERAPNLSADGRLTSVTSLHSVLRLTPRAAAALDAVLGAEPPS
jgi:uncharacterized protein (TIGR02996 family)